MAGEGNYSPYVIIGKLSRDFILTSDGEDINDIPGGHFSCFNNNCRCKHNYKKTTINTCVVKKYLISINNNKVLITQQKDALKNILFVSGGNSRNNGRCDLLPVKQAMYICPVDVIQAITALIRRKP